MIYTNDEVQQTTLYKHSIGCGVGSIILKTSLRGITDVSPKRSVNSFSQGSTGSKSKYL